MIVAIGIDMIEIARIEEIFARRGDRFLNRVFTEAEKEYCDRRASKMASYAARFAAKEAAMKALGTGWAEGVAWRDVEIIIAGSGSPSIQLHGRALERMRKLNATRAHVSLTHTNDLAMAEVILET
jgi:holo-[acyl-carrier protein] synthase